MIMLGRSPIIVEAPPRFEAISSAITRGRGSISSARATRRVNGTITIIVARLLRQRESTKVNRQSRAINARGETVPAAATARRASRPKMPASRSSSLTKPMPATSPSGSRRSQR
jgi:hypothetical protein